MQVNPLGVGWRSYLGRSCQILNFSSAVRHHSLTSFTHIVKFSYIKRIRKNLPKRTVSGFRPLFGDWTQAKFGHGIPTTRSEPSPYLEDCPVLEGVSSTLWRDVSDRSSILKRYDGYETRHTFNVDPESYSLAVEDVLELAGSAFLSPCEVGPSLLSLPGSSSAGYPYLRQRSECFPDIQRDTKILRRTIKGGRPFVYPCMASSRRVIRPVGENKPRLVWAYPGAVSCLEQQFALPLSEWIKNFTPHGANVQWMDKFKWFRQLSPFEDTYTSLTLDFSSFDASVPAFVIRDAFDILRNQFDLTPDQDKQWQFIVNYFIHTPLMLYGEVKQKHRGIPSGSCFTSIIGTICNMIVCHYVARLHKFKLSRSSKWLGDDSRLVIIKHQTGSVRDIACQYSEGASDFGMTVHPDKCRGVLSYDCNRENEYYLGSFLSRNFHFTYPQLRFDRSKFLGQILIPEHRDKRPGDTLDRLIGLTYAYGFDREAYNILKVCYSWVTTHFPSSPSMSERQINKFNRFLHFNFTAETWKFPAFEAIHTRYFGYS